MCPRTAPSAIHSRVVSFRISQVLHETHIFRWQGDDSFACVHVDSAFGAETKKNARRFVFFSEIDSTGFWLQKEVDDNIQKQKDIE